jgi:two-component system sensor histidine kinase QseC
MARNEVARGPDVSGYSPELHVVVWEQGKVRLDTHGLALALPAPLSLGHQTLTVARGERSTRYQTYVAEATTPQGSSRRVAVLVDISRLKTLARDIAEHIVRPAIVLLPLIALLLGWVIRRGLRPVNQLSQEIANLNVDTGQMLEPDQPFLELVSTVEAINGLVQRLQMQAQRERQFASDVAHELRTPLTALVLQARLMREASAPEQRDAAAEQVEQQALRSGRILSQLLDLARAQNLDRHTLEQVDLCALARNVLSEQAPGAHDLSQELGLEAPANPVWVSGHVTMLTLAVRNLVNNAIRHTPPGTQIEVRIEQTPTGETVLSVNDDGARAGASMANQPGLGIGLTLVRRIAEWHGIALSTDHPQEPFTTRFALVWAQGKAPGA